MHRLVPFADTALMAGAHDGPTEPDRRSISDDANAAVRMAMLAGVSARLASSPASELEHALAESLDDVRITIGADRWLFVFHPAAPSSERRSTVTSSAAWSSRSAAVTRSR